MKKALITLTVLISTCSCALAGSSSRQIIANPINLNYQFLPEDSDPARRECADPTAEYFNGYYYIFASVSNGYWRSKDLANWEHISSPSIATINDYAPAILPIGDTLYFTASGDDRGTRIFKTKTPEDGNSWVEIECKLDCNQHDPAFFIDDDNRVYFYWGCSNANPIMGFEVDPNDGFKAKGEPVALIKHDIQRHGWENFGANNDKNENGWNEGPAVFKHAGKYYLQYASPGTEFRVYSDGAYVSDNPLGPYEYMEDSPFSTKPGGFIGSAGHGHTFKDKYGNYWHIASMLIGVRHKYERRLGLFPVHVDSKNSTVKAHTVFSDYPFAVPDRKIDFSDFSTLSMGWRQLSLDKPASASSSARGHDPALATDETIETWWAASTGNKGEWIQIDLGAKETVYAIQMNFADEGIERYTVDNLPYADPVVYRYIIEGSDDGKKWHTIIDRSSNSADAPHELIVLDKAVKTRFVRVSNSRDMDGQFSLMDIRIFGKNRRKALPEVNGFEAIREAGDSRAFSFSWDAVPEADGYILYWGTDKDNPAHAVMVRDTKYSARYFNRDSEYFFRVEAF